MANDTRAMIDGMLAQLEQSGGEMDGLSLDDLKAAMSHPEAPAMIQEIFEADERSVKEGEVAPDFTLSRLGGPQAGESVTLSATLGERPIALIFGSYT